jgi:hypothetical protein
MDVIYQYIIELHNSFSWLVVTSIVVVENAIVFFIL